MSRTRYVITKPKTYLTTTVKRNGYPYKTYRSVEQYELRTMTDTSTPDYHQKIKDGEIVNFGCNMIVNKESSGHGSAYWEQYSGAWKMNLVGSPTAYFAQWGPSNLPIPSLASEADRAKLQAIARMDTTPYEMLEDVFEIRETLRFLRNPLSAIKDLSKAFDKRKKYWMKRGKSRPDAIASAWLQYRFAFTPLVRSALDIADSIGHTDNRPATRTARGYVKASETVTDTATGSVGTFSRKASRVELTRAGISYYISNPARDVRHTYGLRNKDIPLGIWAVMPYSFMIDRIADISSGIKAFTNLSDPDLTIRFGFISTRTDDNSVMKVVALHNYQNVQLSADQVPFHSKFVMNRQPWSPTYFDTVPPVNLSGLVDSVTKVIDLVTIIMVNMK